VIRRDHRIQRSARAGTDEALAGVAIVLAEAAQDLVPGCTAAVVAVDLGCEWRVLAKRGPQDISSCWRHLVADHDRGVDSGSGPSDPVVMQFPSAGFRAMLIVLPADGGSLAPDVRETVHPLLDAGGVLLGAAGSAAPSDHSHLRLVRSDQTPAEEA
jgi:hypothetical protein